MNTIRKASLLQKRRWRIRKKVFGTNSRPRLAVKFTAKHIYAQAINDTTGHTLAFLSSLDSDLRAKKLTSNIIGATTLGQAFAAKAKAAGIESVVFDRCGARYHGKVKAFADAARVGGLTF